MNVLKKFGLDSSGLKPGLLVAGWSWLTMHFILSVLLCSSVWNNIHP
jgi:hypothetical protein